MKAVIMAGGEGTRLRPMTALRPKPMVPIVNQPVMEHILGLVKHHGINDVVATLQFMPQVIEDYFRDGEEWGMNVSYTVEETPLGTAGSVKYAAEALDDTFLVISGDALTDIDLTEVIRFHKERGGLVTIALKRVPDPLEFGVVITREDGRIERFLEKPTWGQVFSDTINTGIYVMEPSVLDYVPSGRPFDFSSQLFPLLMDKGFDLYGCVVDGYWCDVGSLQSYVQVHRDVLDGKAMIYIPGVKTADEAWIGPGAQIDPSARLGRKVVIGENTKVDANAEIADYTVLGDNCAVGSGACIGHSVVWNDTFVGGGAKIRGSVLQRRVDVRGGAQIEVGSVVGDEAMVGQDAVVGNDVAIYPFKRIEPGAHVTSSLIWENRASRTLFGTEGVKGLLSVDITPEMALRLAQAYGTSLPARGHVVVSRDGSAAGRMIKRAIIAGLNSTGVNVRDLRVVSPAVNRFTARDTRCVGGIHVCASARDPQWVEIHFYDSQGLDLSSGDEKKIERLYFRQEFRRSFFDEVGEIIYPPRALEYYNAGLLGAHAAEDKDRTLPQPRLKVVVDMRFGATSFILPQVASSWNLDLIALHPFLDADRTYTSSEERCASDEELRHHVRLFGAGLGLAVDAAGESVTLVTPSGRVLTGDEALQTMVSLWCRTDSTGKAVAVPLSASQAIERIAGATGHRVVRAGLTRRALSAAALSAGVGFAGSRDGGFIFPAFLASYDAVMTLGSLVDMLRQLGEDLDSVYEALPPTHLRAIDVFCPVDRKGAVMRALAQGGHGERVEMREGIHVFTEGGWALMLPHATEPTVEVFAEGVDDANAQSIAERFASLVAAAAGA